MRLLRSTSGGDLELISFHDEHPPPYAILSHTWIEDQEVTYSELVAGTGKQKTGYNKILLCSRWAAADDLQYFWVDTCCINKSASHELSTAINSMFRWYQHASKCYVYLSDVAVTEEVVDAEAFQISWEAAFRRSRWFTRGWTLQELLAPPCVEFFSKEGKRLGSKISLEREIHKITAIPVAVLRGQSLAERSVEERMDWVAPRTTTLKEDKVYCLLGIFGVFLPVIYGEGEAYAKMRLRDEIQRRQEGSTASTGLFMVPFSRDDLFVGRKDILTNIGERITAVHAHLRTALVGLGGVGKSQIAIEYAYRCRAAEPQTLVLWIHASDRSRFQQGCRDIADRLALPGRDDAKVDVLQLVCGWLSDARNGRWLMVLDNVDDDSVFFGDGTSKPLESFLPQISHGMILITSRNEVAATNLVGGHGNVIQVKPMGEEEALALLHTRVPFSESSRADAKALVNALERIPLAISHAAAYIKTRASLTSISSYLRLFLESEVNKVHLLSRKDWKDIRRDHSIRDAVIATWHISFKHIQTAEPQAADLLALMSMFDKQGIPRWLVQGTSSDLDFEDALAPLVSFSLVRTEIGKQALEMHRLVQLSMRKWLEGKKELSKWVKQSIAAVSEAFPSGEYETWEACKALLPHLNVVVGYAVEDEDDVLGQARCNLNAGRYLLEKGEYTAAERMTCASLAIREKVLGRKHPATLKSVRNLGFVLSMQGKYKEAEALHRQALETTEKLLGQEHLDTLTSVSNLGIVLQREGKYEEAEVMHRQALEVSEKLFGREHINTLTSVSNLGIVLESQRKHEEAEMMHLRALEGSEKLLGREHPNTLTSVNNLGSVLSSQRKYKEAEVMHLRALEGSEKVLGREHPDTLVSVYQLAYASHRQGNLPTAVALYQRAYDGRVKVLGPQHPRTRACWDGYQSARKQLEAHEM
ncbi:kinesin light chain 1 [Pyrenochaeta sp. DS3sAY3a]|nr:kinesin light chain 1 [Pyrenochaeta sp. DS3sAY3a]